MKQNVLLSSWSKTGGEIAPRPTVPTVLNRYGQWQQLCVCTLWSKWLASEKDPNHLRQQITKDSKVSPCDHSLGYCLKVHIAMRSCFQYQTNWWTKRHLGQHRLVISKTWKLMKQVDLVHWVLAYCYTFWTGIFMLVKYIRIR